MASPRTTIRCLVCGKRSARSAYCDGVLKRHVAEQLIQEFVGCGAGVDRDGNVPVDDHGRPVEGRGRGAFKWTRLRMTRSQLELVATATLAAAERLQRYLDGEIPAVDPATVLRSLTNEELGAYFHDTRREQSEREKLIDAEVLRREGDR